MNLRVFFADSNDVKAKLCKLKMNKAPGIDSVGSRMLIEIADEISLFVAELYNKSLKIGICSKRMEIGKCHTHI